MPQALFLSYSFRNEEFVELLARFLRTQRPQIETYFYQNDRRAEEWERQLGPALRICSCCVAIVGDELGKTQQREMALATEFQNSIGSGSKFRGSAKPLSLRGRSRPGDRREYVRSIGCAQVCARIVKMLVTMGRDGRCSPRLSVRYGEGHHRGFNRPAERGGSARVSVRWNARVRRWERSGPTFRSNGRRLSVARREVQANPVSPRNIAIWR